MIVMHYHNPKLKERRQYVVKDNAHHFINGVTNNPAWEYEGYTEIKEMNTDPYVEAVKAKYDKRSADGKEKYGTDLTREDLSHDEWLTHLQEELMDGSLYIERLKGFRTEIQNEVVGNVFRELQTDIFQNAIEHGFWDGNGKSFPENIALMHSELSEALEEYRNKKSNHYYKSTKTGREYKTTNISNPNIPYGSDIGEPWDGADWGTTLKPEGIYVELADVIIRIMDAAEHDKVDLWSLIVEKHLYNKTRPFMHGGKKI